VHSFSKVDWSVLLPEVQVGRGARLTKCIVDRGCTIPDGMVVGEDPEADAARFNRTSRGVTLINREMLARLG
jgi:glucose-1-phosphate adenylyltransferase